MFSSTVFIVFYVILSSVTHSEVTFGEGVRSVPRFFLVQIEIQLLTSSIIAEKTTLSPPDCLFSWVKDQLVVFVCAFILFYSSASLFFHQHHMALITITLEKILKSGIMISPLSFFNSVLLPFFPLVLLLYVLTHQIKG